MRDSLRSIRMSDLMALTIPYLCLSALPRGQYRSSAIAQLALRLVSGGRSGICRRTPRRRAATAKLPRPKFRSGLFPWLWAGPRDVGFCTSDYECSLTGPHARTRLAPPPMGLCGCFLREASTNRPDPRHGPSSATEGSFRREDVLATSRPAVQEIRDH